MSKIKSFLSYNIRKIETIFYSTFFYKNRTIICITGCGRSGTTFSAQVLRQMGLNIGHERLRKNGISSWYLVSKNKKVQLGSSLYDLRKMNKVIIHQVREPLASISSMLSTGSPSWKFLSKEIPISIENDSKILRAMKYYYYWNLQTEDIADVRIKAENFLQEIEKTLMKFQVEFNSNKVTITKGSMVNTRKHDKLTWSNLKNEDEVLAEKISLLGKKYGY
jgi:hypothetical protein